MEMMTVAGLVLAGTIVVVLVAFAVGERLSGRVRRRLQGLTSVDTEDAGVQQGEPALDAGLVERLIGRRAYANLVTQLSAAGLPMRPGEFISLTVGGAALGAVVAVFFVRNIMAYIVLPLLLGSIPFMVVKILEARRLSAFNGQIVDALLMIASSLKSGFSFLRAMQMVSQELPPPISEEFRRAVYEVNVGRPVEEALKNIAARMKSYDFDLIVVAVLIQLQVSGNLAEILETIAGTIRERVRIKSEIQALTAEGRISTVILVLMPVALAVILSILKPGYLDTLVATPVGQTLIWMAVGMLAVGIYVLRRMLVIDI